MNKRFSQLTEHIYKEKAVIVYIETGDGYKNGMPYVLHRGGQENGENFLWTETYDFDYTVGEISFYLTISDFLTGNKPTNATTFHVVLIW